MNAFAALILNIIMVTCRIPFQMANILTKDFDELIQTYENDLNEEMLLKGPLRRGLVVHLHSKVGRTEYLKTATSVAHILNLNKISWSQNIEALKVTVGKLCRKLCALKKNLNRNWETIVQLLNDDYAIPMSDLPQQIPAEIQDPIPPTAKWLRTDCNKLIINNWLEIFLKSKRDYCII